jgi:cyclopropane fatty-acyl-phospholipid synthase-like methyltransferase
MAEQHPEWASLVHLEHEVDHAALTWLTSGLGSGNDNHRPIVLDVGCGPGLPLDRLLLEAGFDVVAVDDSPVAVDTARDTIPEAIHMERDLYDLAGLHPVGDRFDAAVSLFALAAMSHHDIDRTLTEIHHVLAPGAPFLLAMPEGDGELQPQDFLGESVPQTAFHRDGLEELLERNGFTVLQVRPARQSDDHVDLYARCLTR